MKIKTKSVFNERLINNNGQTYNIVKTRLVHAH